MVMPDMSLNSSLAIWGPVPAPGRRHVELAWIRDLYQVSGIAETVHMDHIKRHYYGSHKQLNPAGIVPVGPELRVCHCHLL